MAALPLAMAMEVRGHFYLLTSAYLFSKKRVTKMPQSNLAFSSTRRSKSNRRCCTRLTPYSTEQRKRNRGGGGGSLNFIPNHRPTTTQLEVVQRMLSKTWGLYRLSPLWQFSSDSSKLRSYSLALNRQVQGQLSTQAGGVTVQQYTTKITSLPGFGLDGSEAIEISIRQRQSRRSRGSPEFTAFLCDVEKSEFSPQRGFSYFPLLLVHGSVQHTKTLFEWLQHTFDCQISPFKLAQEELSTLVSEYASADRDGPGVGNVQLVYNLPESVRQAGLSTILLELSQDSAVSLWEETGNGNSRINRRKAFVKILNDHIHKHFHLKLESMALSRISTPVLHADSMGRLKFNSPNCVIPVLSVLQLLLTS